MRSRRPRHDRGHDPRPSLPRETPEAVADAELGERIEQALRDGPGSGHVDVAQLLRGTRLARTKRARVRRTAMIAAAAVAVGAVPVGLQTARWMSPRPVVPGTGVATVSEPTPSPTRTPSQRPTPSGQPPQASPTSRFGRDLGDDPNSVLYDIPDSVAFDRADLPAAMSLNLDLGQYRWIPTVQGQVCNEARSKRMEQPVAGRAWMWARDPARGSDELQVDLNVTGWASEKSAEAQLVAVRRNLGACRFDQRISTVVSKFGDWTALGFLPNGSPQVYTVQEVGGGLIVAVTVTSATSTDLALKTASTLIQEAVRNVERSGLPKELVALQAKGLTVAAPGATQPTSPAADPGAANSPATANG